MFAMKTSEGAWIIGDLFIVQEMRYTAAILRGMKISDRYALGIYTVREQYAAYDPETQKLSTQPQFFESGAELILQYTAVDLTAAEIQARRPTLSAKLFELVVAYKADITTLQQKWLAAAVSDGDAETAAAKAEVVTAIADRKAQYLSDVADLRAYYGV